ncbi:hypothetical protein, partial [Pantoea septica]|uniref:hypothetical protein n=1 Tax=Pantoea septica TaxID=472695 RepID=UPI00289A3A81
TTLANPTSHVTRFIKMCDVEQRLNTENINLPTQSSKELISALHCAHFDQLLHFFVRFSVAMTLGAWP